jgi:hypothetical protein
MKSIIAGIGFTMCLIGAGALAESFGDILSTTISALLLIIGGILLYRGNRDEKENNEHSVSNRNVLDRLYFLR